MRAGRARGRIENEPFNPLKNPGDCFEHNFGHGYRSLSTVFASLRMLAFLIDQVQQRCGALFHRAQAKAGRARYFWERVRALLLNVLLADGEMLYKTIASQAKLVVVYDTS